MSEDSRADRLRRRRRQQRERPSDEQPADERTADDDEDDAASIKDDRVGTYMYLPEELKRELDFAFRELSLDYERAFSEEFEKNRHFYPLVIRAGLDRVDDLDEAAIRERLDEIE